MSSLRPTPRLTALIVLLGLGSATLPAHAQPADPQPGAGGPATGLGSLAGVGGAAGAMQSGELPSGLDSMIALALRANPDVLLAEAKLRQAQAELNAARLKVTQDVVMAFQGRNTQKEVLGAKEAGLEMSQKMVESGQAPQGTLAAARVEVIQARAMLDQQTAQLRYLCGIGGTIGGLLEAGGVTGGAGPFQGGMGDAAPSSPPPPPPRRPPLTEDQAAKLRVPVTVSAADSSVAEILDGLSQASGVPFVQGSPHGDVALSLRLANIPLEQALVAISDQMAGMIVFVVRDYGILATTADRAEWIYAPTVPDDTPLDPEVAARAAK